jgi:hypothetical protein
MLALSLLLALGGSASAEVLWCEDDPIITVEGRTVHLVSRFAQTDLAAVRGPVLYEVAVPSNVGRVQVRLLPSPVADRVTVAYSLDPWSGDGELPMAVRVTVSATRDFPTWVRVFGPAIGEPFTASGHSNQATRISLELGN